MSIDNVGEVAATANTAMGTGATLMSLLPMVLIFAIFYFFLIRPQVKKQKEMDRMISELKKGDKVIAAGGIYATINKIEDSIISLEIAENTKIKVSKSAITEVLSTNKSLITKVEDAAEEANKKTKKSKKAD